MLTKGLALKPELTAQRLRELLHYDPETGVFTWLADRLSVSGRLNAKAGDRAGYIGRSGYLQMSIDGCRCYGHRLAFLYMNGEWPATGVDHLDRNPSNNSWGNLRAVSQSENLRNRGPNKGNTSGRVGVYWSKPHGKWVARIKVGGRGRHIGIFQELADAISAREQAEAVYFRRPPAS